MKFEVMYIENGKHFLDSPPAQKEVAEKRCEWLKAHGKPTAYVREYVHVKPNPADVTNLSEIGF